MSILIKNKEQFKKLIKLKKKIINNTKSNLIYNLNYKSTDLDNNTYMIKSDSGEISQNGMIF